MVVVNDIEKFKRMMDIKLSKLDDEKFKEMFNIGFECPLIIKVLHF